MAITGAAALRSRLDELVAEAAPRAGSFVVTLFGDVISQQGGSVWLGSLIRILENFGLNERQVRTAVFRLARDDWLIATRRGRRSYYQLSTNGERQFERAARRIYAAGLPAWDGHWTLVMTSGIDALQREELRRRLGWLGFAALHTGLLAHPRVDETALGDVLEELEIAGRVMVWRARTDDTGVLRARVNEAWQLDEAAAAFQNIVERYTPLCELLKTIEPQPHDAFVLRVLLIHEYRRTLLRTIEVPPDLLPQAWPGESAMRLVAALYRQLRLASSKFASEAMLNEHGALPSPDRALAGRFASGPVPLERARA